MGLREDDAFSILANIEGQLQIDHTDSDFTNSLEYLSYDASRSMEETVSSTLLAMKNAEHFYSQVFEAEDQASNK